MNAREHFALAEELGGPLGDWREAVDDGEVQIVLTRAQLHASLALAAEQHQTNVRLAEIGHVLQTRTVST